MLGLILGFVTGLAGPLMQLAGSLTDLQKAKIAAQTDVQKAAINRQIEEVHDKRQVLVAEAGNRINASVRFLLALGPLVILSKLLIWDKSIGPFYGCVGRIVEGCKAFNTDSLDPNLWWVVLAVVGFYYVTTMRR